MPPLVSVVIPAYNAEQTVLRAIGSVLQQTYRATEIIVINDASNDNTEQRIRSLANKSVQLICLPANQGAAASRNVGIQAAKGKYVAFLDADDAWLPRKLETQVELMEVDPRLALVTCDAVFEDLDGRMIKRSHAKHPPSTGDDAWVRLLADNFVPTPTVLARRDDLHELQGFNEGLVVGEDWDLWIRLAMHGNVGVVPEVLVKVFVMPNSLMHRTVHQHPQIVVPLLEKHLLEQRQRLSPVQIKYLRGRMAFTTAANAYASGQYGCCASLFWRSAKLRYRSGKSVVNILRAVFMAMVTRNPR